MRFHSSKYPELLVVDLGLKFVDGFADVEDQAAIDRLLGLEEMGVTPVDSEEDAEPEAEDDSEESGPVDGTVDFAEPKRKQGRTKKTD